MSSHSIRIVLIETSHTGNLGASARAMKTMGLDTLYLVNPVHPPDEQAQAMAAQATDLLTKAKVVKNLQQAISNCHLIFGTSARARTLAWPTLNVRQAAELAINSAEQNIAFLFGREKTGLTNEELQYCHYQVVIPANPAYSSLNLAAAVQILAYELRMAKLNISNPIVPTDQEPLSTAAELEGFYNHLEQILYQLEFLKPNLPNQVLPRLKRLFARTQLSKIELNILRGFLTAIEQKL